MSIALAPGMTGAWAEQYKAWLPFARQAVLETVDRWGTAAAIRELAGTDLADEMIELLRRDWYQPFRSYLNRTGKMIRPVLVCLTARSLGADPVKAPSLVAMAEMIHSSSLVLDDIADDSDLRRGEPTAHRMVGVCTAGALGSSWLNMCFDILANSQSNLHDSSRRRCSVRLERDADNPLHLDETLAPPSIRSGCSRSPWPTIPSNTCSRYCIARLPIPIGCRSRSARV